MELKDFNELDKQDFDNGAVLDAIRQVFKERDTFKLRADCTHLDDACTPCNEECSYNTNH